MSRKTARVQALLLRAGRWTEDEMEEIREMTGLPKGDYPRVDRRQQYEIEGDWTPVREHTKPLSLDDSGRKTRRATEDDAQRGLNDTWPGDGITETPPINAADLSTRPTSSHEERISYVERMQELLWKAIHDQNRQIETLKARLAEK